MPAHREQLLDRARVGDDGRAGVEDEALILVDIGAPAGLVALLDQGRVEPAACSRMASAIPPKPAPITAALGLTHTGLARRGLVMPALSRPSAPAGG